jgi:hypothetical protein
MKRCERIHVVATHFSPCSTRRLALDRGGLQAGVRQVKSHEDGDPSFAKQGRPRLALCLPPMTTIAPVLERFIAHAQARTGERAASDLAHNES